MLFFVNTKAIPGDAVVVDVVDVGIVAFVVVNVIDNVDAVSVVNAGCDVGIVDAGLGIDVVSVVGVGIGFVGVSVVNTQAIPDDIAVFAIADVGIVVFVVDDVVDVGAVVVFDVSVVNAIDNVYAVGVADAV